MNIQSYLSENIDPDIIYPDTFSVSPHFIVNQSCPEIYLGLFIFENPNRHNKLWIGPQDDYFIEPAWFDLNNKHHVISPFKYNLIHHVPPDKLRLKIIYNEEEFFFYKDNVYYLMCYHQIKSIRKLAVNFSKIFISLIFKNYFYINLTELYPVRIYDLSNQHQFIMYAWFVQSGPDFGFYPIFNDEKHLLNSLNYNNLDIEPIIKGFVHNHQCWRYFKNFHGNDILIKVDSIKIP